MRVALTGHRPQRLGLPEDELDIKWSTVFYLVRIIIHQINIITSSKTKQMSGLNYPTNFTKVVTM